jgi:hypothetical protein
LPAADDAYEVTPHLTYRKAVEPDVYGIAALHAESWRLHSRGAYLDAYLDGDVVSDSLEVWTSRLTLPGQDQCTVVAAGADGIAGFAHTLLDHDPQWGPCSTISTSGASSRETESGRSCCRTPLGACSNIGEADPSTFGYWSRTRRLRRSTPPERALGSRPNSGDPFPAAEEREATGTSGRMHRFLSCRRPELRGHGAKLSAEPEPPPDQKMVPTRSNTRPPRPATILMV